MDISLGKYGTEHKLDVLLCECCGEVYCLNCDIYDEYSENIYCLICQYEIPYKEARILHSFTEIA